MMCLCFRLSLFSLLSVVDELDFLDGRHSRYPYQFSVPNPN